MNQIPYVKLLLAMCLLFRMCEAEDKIDAPPKGENLNTLKRLLSRSPGMASEPKEFAEHAQLTEVLKLFGDDAVSILCSIVSDKKEQLEVRCGAEWTLGELGDKRAIPTLTSTFGELPSALPSTACIALGKIESPDLVPDLLKIASSDDTDLVHDAFSAIRHLKLKCYVPKLLPLLLDNKQEIRAIAAEGLGNIGDKDAVPGLILMLNDTNEGVIMLAAQALGRIGDASAVDALRVRARIAGDIFLKKYLVDAIREIADRQAINWLAEQKIKPGKDGVPALRSALIEKDSNKRSNAATALKDLGENAAEAIPELVKALNDDEENVRVTSMEALIAIGKPSINSLGQALDSPNWNVKDKAIIALGRLAASSGKKTEEFKVVVPQVVQLIKKSDDVITGASLNFLMLLGLNAEVAIPQLIEMLDHKTPNVAYAAALTLAGISERAIPALEHALTDKRAQIRRRAAFTLGQMGVPAHSLAMEIGVTQKIPSIESMDTLRIEVTTKSVVPHLIEALQDDDAGVRRMAAFSLGRMSKIAKEALPKLRRVSKEEKDENVLNAVKEAIVKINASQGRF